MQRIAVFFAIVLACLACSQPGPEVLATNRGGDVTLSDLDRHIRSLPEGQRIAPTTGRATWFREMIRKLAIQEILEAGDEVQELLTGSEAEAKNRWATIDLLAAAVGAQLTSATHPTDQAVAEQLAALGTGAPKPLDSFHHIFLRLDGLETAAETEAVRRLGQDLVQRARAGEDFVELVRLHSQSSDAATGGLVVNQHPAGLEAAARQTLRGLAEGDVSELVETRTGLHIFKLERRITPRGGASDTERLAHSLAARQALSEARSELLTKLRQDVEISVSELPWQVGSFEVTEVDLGYINIKPSKDAKDGNEELQREAIIEHLLFAEHGRRRGLATAALDARVAEAQRREAIQAVYQRIRNDLVAKVPTERLRATYDAQPSAFATIETADLDLIFVAQGRDSFVTQQKMEAHVTDLRSGADFAELARRISSGPRASVGGDLGALAPKIWARLGPEIYKAVAGLPEGAFSDPIYCTDRLLTSDPWTLRGGFAIVHVQQKHPPTQRSFEEALDAVRTTWARKNSRQLDEETAASILEGAGFRHVRLPKPEEHLE